MPESHISTAEFEPIRFYLGLQDSIALWSPHESQTRISRKVQLYKLFHIDPDQHGCPAGRGHNERTDRPDVNPAMLAFSLALNPQPGTAA